MLDEELSNALIEITRLKKDMLAMEEYVNAHKMMKEKHTLTWVRKTPATNTNTTGGTGIAYTTSPKPNETYTDEEPVIKKRYGFHR